MQMPAKYNALYKKLTNYYNGKPHSWNYITAIRSVRDHAFLRDWPILAEAGWNNFNIHIAKN